MATHRFEFTHDGHVFSVDERSTTGAPARADDGDDRVSWCVRMDGATVLEFSGHFPYRDDDLRKRVLEWYSLQRPA